MSIRSLLFVISAGLFALVISPGVSAAQPAFPFAIDVPAMPAKLVVEAGHEVFLVGHAVGTQNYACLPTATGVAWKPIGPQATLFVDLPRDFQQQIATHFLSANPDENGVARPTWQQSFDSSEVWGALMELSDDANFVAPGAIPWLLLRVAGRALGPEGGSSLTQAKFIQRLNTSGGVAPATGCSQAANVGAIALVPYGADYFFYRTSSGR
jgi:Protein of unknown function (DUF3455)